MRKRPIPRTELSKGDPSPSFSKKTQLGASGAVVGAIIGGPIGAVVGGIVGTVFGAAAEISPDGNHLAVDALPPPDKPTRATSQRRKSSARSRAKGSKSASAASGVRPRKTRRGRR